MISPQAQLGSPTAELWLTSLLCSGTGRVVGKTSLLCDLDRLLMSGYSSKSGIDQFTTLLMI
jgi:hypothetical protein